MLLKHKLRTIFATNIYARFIRFKFSLKTQILMMNRKKRHIYIDLFTTYTQRRKIIKSLSNQHERDFLKISLTFFVR